MEGRLDGRVWSKGVKLSDIPLEIRRERERERFYYRLRRSNMTYETKNITFHVVRVKRNLPMNVIIESAHCGCERNSCKDWAWSKMCGKQLWSNMIALYQSVILKLSYLFRAKFA